VVGTGLAVLLDTHVTQPDTGDRSVVVEETLRAGEAGEDIRTQAFRFLRQPGCQETQGDDEVAVVVQLRRQGQRETSRPGEESEFVTLGRNADAWRRLTPLEQQGIQRPRFHDGA